MDKKEKEVVAKIINEKAKDVIYGNKVTNAFVNVPEETKQEVKEITEKLQIELDKRSLKNKSKEQLIEDLGDLYDLFELKSNEAEETKKNLQDVEGDLIIKNDVIKQSNAAINIREREISNLNKEMRFQNKMQLKLEEIIDKLIGIRR